MDLNNLVENLKKDLMISVRGNKDKVFIDDDTIYINVPPNEEFLKSFRQLCEIVPLTVRKLDISNIRLTVTNGYDENYITF